MDRSRLRLSLVPSNGPITAGVADGDRRVRVVDAESWCMERAKRVEGMNRVIESLIRWNRGKSRA